MEPTTIKNQILANLLGCDAVEVVREMPEGVSGLEALCSKLAEHADTAALERYLTPQWVVLAAGKGTRIDATGRLSKTLDIMFGEESTLQRSRRYLPGNRPHIVVINPQMAARVEDSTSAVRLLGREAIVCIQSEMNGTGGALQAALPALRDTDAEWIGVAFGDEPFLQIELFAQTLLSHFMSGADVTLCGKVPETVVDKGGLFFDTDGELIGTKEWYDMTSAEKVEMWHRWEHGEAYTNTGITLIRKSALLERMHRLQPHTNRNGELHHVDLIRHCYEDGLKTNAFIYSGEVLSGVNRWSNVLSGEAALFEQTRRQFAQSGVRVDPAAQITFAGGDHRVHSPQSGVNTFAENLHIGTGCYLLGRIHLGENVQIGDYCRLENVTLFGATTVGDAVGLQDVSANDTTFESNPLPATLAAPVRGLATGSTIKNCTFDGVTVGTAVQLSDIQARATVIPSGISLADRMLGLGYVPLQSRGKSLSPAQPPGVPASLFNQIVPSDYSPGVFTFGEKRALPDWDNLREHVRSHSITELIPRATRNLQLRQLVGEAVRTLLDMRQCHERLNSPALQGYNAIKAGTMAPPVRDDRDNDSYLIEALTPEELWGVIFEMVTLHTGNPNPYHQDKLKARQTALELLSEFWEVAGTVPVPKPEGPRQGRPFRADSWLTWLKLVVAGNVIDYSSSRVLAKLKANPDYFSEALRAAVETPFAIDCYEQFREKVIDGPPQQLLWLADNDGEAVFDLALIQELARCGHRLCVVGKADNASNDATLADLHEIVNFACYADVRTAIRDGIVTLISSGAKTIGTNLYQATPEFANALLEADLVISKGQGNFYTTPGWAKDTFYFLLSKGLTAERSTGVVADKSLPIDGLILAYVRGGTRRDTPLRDICRKGY